MHLQGPPQMLVEPLPSPGMKTPQRAKSNESLQGNSVKRALSFSSTPDKQQAPEESKAQLALENPDLEEPKPEECKDQDRKAEEPQPQEPKPLEPKPEEPKPLQPQPEEPKLEELQQQPKTRVTGKQAPASAPAKSLPKPGSLTIPGRSGLDTYEARQLLSNLLGSAEEAVTGLVGKGLPVVPGQWARLSNISADGKWLRTERFKIGAKEIVHSQGASVGRILEAYRKVRASHPELVAQLDITSQPAANVDSVILSWCIEKQATEHPCSLWQRDCFSSVFSESATRVMALAQQVSCLVAAKCTSKLQITDSDFAKQFKSLVRKKLIELRHDFQHKPQAPGQDAVFRVGALEIVQAVVSAQQAMSEKNAEDQWVLRAAVRNGILAWRTKPSERLP